MNLAECNEYDWLLFLSDYSQLSDYNYAQQLVKDKAVKVAIKSEGIVVRWVYLLRMLIEDSMKRLCVPLPFFHGPVYIYSASLVNHNAKFPKFLWGKTKTENKTKKKDNNSAYRGKRISLLFNL